MPKRTDIKKILIIGSGPIIIGQACEFDYSGTQACKALREEGYEVVLVNSNPATIMTDPDIADKTYIEPITPEMVAKIIVKEKPEALLPTLGGQTGLNTAVSLAENGDLDKYGVELIGAKLPAIKKAEDRTLFKEAMEHIGLSVPNSCYARSFKESMEFLENDHVTLPVIIRPSFTLGGSGISFAHNLHEYEDCVKRGLDASPVSEILIEESIAGWKEYELEVMRDTNDNVIIVCSIENLDPMGIHTGDSITVAPAQTLTDKEYQLMRNASIDIIREIGVETGGSNIQFAVNPENGDMTVIEMNPRVSRSSALASKATGFPIAKIAAKLAVGYTLDEIPNDITKYTPASFEPTIDYCVVKIPRFNFEKFLDTDPHLNAQMKSVGEVMAIGRTFKESIGKALRSLEIGRCGFTDCGMKDDDDKIAIIKEKFATNSWERLWYVAEAMRFGMSLDEIYESTKIDKWFLFNIKQIIDCELQIKEESVNSQSISHDALKEAKQYGISDMRIAQLIGKKEEEIRELRKSYNIRPVFKHVDTCAAEFKAYTPYLYSTYESECEADPTDKKKVIILGSGPNRIGQGIEFDYCCVHAVMALKELGYETIMVNCNPETVSTDYDTSDRLYFEPLTFEDVMEIIEKENPMGVIVQFGGQTPLKLAAPLENAGVKILGTSPDNIDRAENRERFSAMLKKLGLKQPENGMAQSFEEAKKIAGKIVYPVLIRPSYVLGGQAMCIAYDDEELEQFVALATDVSPGHPVLIDKFLEDAIEVDVDAICDGKDVFVGGVMEHIEEAGIHSGDSACSLPPYSISDSLVEEIKRQTVSIALELDVLGIINIQYAIRKEEVYVIEVNPRASRTVPFVSKAINTPLAKIATKVMTGLSIADCGLVIADIATTNHNPGMVAVKEAVFPFIKFPGVDTVLSPEMKSTGEVMGLDRDFGRAFAKAQMAASNELPLSGTVFVSVKDKDKELMVPISKTLHDLGFKIMATKSTAKVLTDNGIPATRVLKVAEGNPNIVDHLKNGEVQLVINTTKGKEALKASYSIRRTALDHHVPYFTTVSGARAVAESLSAVTRSGLEVKALQDYYV
ncbi:MAG: carbamoyl-phosphate synthase large subunit [Candidatus Anammoxibacter sp.]